MASISPLLRPIPLFVIATLLRLILLVYGLWQDAHSALKYTDIDYLVFTDASRFLAAGDSPYARDTYRYTPLLAWLLLPTVHFTAFGKLVFAVADLLAGWLMVRVLRQRGMSETKAGGFAALWLWNPMVATISTRGSSEGLLGVLTMGLLWAVERRRISLAAVILGLAVHFKIYPFIYAPAIVWWMDAERLGKTGKFEKPSSPVEAVLKFLSPERIKLAIISLATFMGLNLLMYSM
jgi:phosphatidylinositol glycan class M